MNALLEEKGGKKITPLKHDRTVYVSQLKFPLFSHFPLSRFTAFFQDLAKTHKKTFFTSNKSNASSVLWEDFFPHGGFYQTQASLENNQSLDHCAD